jgi:hypothetical protein
MQRLHKDSLEIFTGLREDLDPELFQKIWLDDGSFDIPLEETYDLIFFNLTPSSKLQKNLSQALQSLRVGGIIIANIIGGNSYQELIESLVRIDLEDNFFMERFLPRLQQDGLMALGKNLGVKYPIVMENHFTYFFDNLEILLRDMIPQEEKYILEGEKKPSWDRVENYYKENFSTNNQMKVTITLLSLFLVKG